MPKLGMEPIRKAALVKATIAEIGAVGSLDVTVAQIARRAGMSSALAHHYFGGKEQIFLAAMRHILALYGAEVRAALANINGPSGRNACPKARILAVIGASFADSNFRQEVVSAWLHFYVLAQTVPEARRLLRVYQRRLRANLLYGLRPLFVGMPGAAETGAAETVADGIGAMVDGLYIRLALARGPMGLGPIDRVRAGQMVADYLEMNLRVGNLGGAPLGLDRTH
jgi:TetR/AcrR family transcriptional regulator, transcriptional repressor of bet genes